MDVGVGIGLSVVAVLATVWWMRQSDAAFAGQLAAAKAAASDATLGDYVTAGVQVYSATQGVPQGGKGK
jgi:hypothetical protein